MKTWIHVVTWILLWCFLGNIASAETMVSEETLEAVKEEAVEQLLTAWNGDIYQTLETEVSAGDVFEQKDHYCMYMVVTAEQGYAARSPWDTHYMMGMCDYIGVLPQEAADMSKEEWEELFLEKGYAAEIAARLADSVLYENGQWDWRLQNGNSTFHYSLYVEFSLTEEGDCREMKVWHDVPELADANGEGRLQPLDYGAPAVGSLYERGYQRMEQLIRIATENASVAEVDTQKSMLCYVWYGKHRK